MAVLPSVPPLPLISVHVQWVPLPPLPPRPHNDLLPLGGVLADLMLRLPRNFSHSRYGWTPPKHDSAFLTPYRGERYTHYRQRTAFPAEVAAPVPPVQPARVEQVTPVQPEAPAATTAAHSSVGAELWLTLAVPTVLLLAALLRLMSNCRPYKQRAQPVLQCEPDLESPPPPSYSDAEDAAAAGSGALPHTGDEKPRHEGPPPYSYATSSRPLDPPPPYTPPLSGKPGPDNACLSV